MPSPNIITSARHVYAPMFMLPHNHLVLIKFGRHLGYPIIKMTSIGNLSKDVFEQHTSTGSEAFSLLICLDANKFVLLSLFSLIKTIYPRVSTEPLSNDAKSPLPVDVHRSKTLLLKLPNNSGYHHKKHKTEKP